MKARSSATRMTIATSQCSSASSICSVAARTDLTADASSNPTNSICSRVNSRRSHRIVVCRHSHFSQSLSGTRMGELLTGLYGDLLELEEVSERPRANEPPTRATNEGDAVEQSIADSRTPPPNRESLPPITRAPGGIPQSTPRHFSPRIPVDMVVCCCHLVDSDLCSGLQKGVSPTKEKVKYFIMKSNNSTNIDRSLASGVWSTQHHNEAKLNNAFLDGFDVRLVFSINQSGHFQG